MQNPVLSPVSGVYWPHDNVVVGLGESQVVGVEDKGVLDGERLSFRFCLECCELYSTRAARFPVLPLGEDFDGEDGVGAQFGLEEGQEVLGYGGFGNV